RCAKYSTASEPMSPLDPVTRISMVIYLIELEFEECGPAHAQHDHSITEAADHFGLAAETLLVMHSKIDQRKMKLGGTEQKVIVAPAIVGAPASGQRADCRPMVAPHHLGAA